LLDKAFVRSVLPVETNIVIFELTANMTAETFVKRLAEHQIKALAISATQVRMVTHLDITEEMIRKTNSVIKEMKD